MSNLSSLRSQLLTSYLKEMAGQLPSYIPSNNYQHHNMPARSIRTRNGKIALSSARKIKSDEFEEEKEKLVKTSRSVGRPIFQDRMRLTLPGPGWYDQEEGQKKIQFKKYGYIHKANQTLPERTTKKMLKKEEVNTKLGPGIYNPIETNLSTHRNALANKFASTPLLRKIVPGKLTENINLCMQVSDKKFYRSDAPGPSHYRPQILSRKGEVYSISKTRRSEIIEKERAPPIGLYKWEKWYQNKSPEKQPKPIIQYKFVYGHPS